MSVKQGGLAPKKRRECHPPPHFIHRHMFFGTPPLLCCALVQHRQSTPRPVSLLMRSPWVGSLALLAPAHGFVAQSVIVRGSPKMLQAFVRPSASGVRAVSSRAWRQESVRLQPLQRVARLPQQSTAVVGDVRMMASGAGAGGGGGKAAAKKQKAKKPESYYKKTVILPQTGFEQVRECPWADEVWAAGLVAWVLTAWCKNFGAKRDGIDRSVVVVRSVWSWIEYR